MKKILLSMFLLATVLLPNLAFADAPPPSHVRLQVFYQGAKADNQKVYATILTCEENNGSDSFNSIYQGLKSDESNPDLKVLTKLNVSGKDATDECTFTPSYLPYFCTQGECLFDWLLGKFKVAVYLPSVDKTFISNTLTRSYEGYYGRDTIEVYRADLSADGKITLTEEPGKTYYTDYIDRKDKTETHIGNSPPVEDTVQEDTPEDTSDDISPGAFVMDPQFAAMTSSLLATLILEIIAALILRIVKTPRARLKNSFCFL